MENCKINYSKDWYFETLVNYFNPEMGEQWVRDFFVEGDKIAELIASNNFNEDSLQEVVINAEQEHQDDVVPEENLDSEYSSESKFLQLTTNSRDSRQNYNRLITNFRNRIMKDVVFDLATRQPILASKMHRNGYSLQNTKLAMYKIELLKKINSVTHSKLNVNIDEITEDTLYKLEDPNVFTQVINTVLSDYQHLLNNNPGKVLDAFNEFFLLSEFNKILTSEFVWMGIDETMKITNMHGVTMYTSEDDKIKHRRGFENDDDAMKASIDRYTSNYMRRILEFIPHVVKNKDGSYIEGYDLEGTGVGFNAFNHAISVVFDWALNSPDSTVYLEAEKGIEADIAKIIQAFLKQNDGEYFTQHRMRLAGVLKYIFHPDTFIEIKNLFANQIAKTIASEYICYETQYDYDSRSYKLVTKNIKSQLVDKQKQSISAAIKAAVYLHSNNFKKFKDDFKEITIKNHAIHIGDYIMLSWKWNNDGLLDISLVNDLEEEKEWSTPDGQNRYYRIMDDFKNIVKKLLNIDLTSNKDISEDDLLMASGGQSIIDLFGNAVGLTILGIYDKIPVKKINDTEYDKYSGIEHKKFFDYEYTGGWSINLSKYGDKYNNAAKYLSILRGSEQYNVLKDLNGNNVPVFQLGSYMHDLKKIIRSIRNNRKTSPYAENIFVKNPGLLGKTFFRLDAKYRDAVSKSKQLTAADVLYLGVTQDFWYQLINNGQILMQPTCNADKSKFDLRQIRLGDFKVNINGQEVNGRDLFIDIATNFEFIKGSHGSYVLNSHRQSRIDAIEKAIVEYKSSKTRKLLADVINRFNKVLGINYTIHEQQNQESFDKAIQNIHDKLISGQYTVKKLEEEFNARNVTFYSESDVFAHKDGILTLNPVLLLYKDWHFDPKTVSEAYRQELDYQKWQFAKDLRINRMRLNIFKDQSLQSIVDKLFNDNNKDLISGWVNEKSGEIATHRVFKREGNTRTEVFLSEGEFRAIYTNPGDNYEIELNPILESYFYANIMFAQSLTDILYNDPCLYATKLKNKDSQAVSNRDVQLRDLGSRLSTMFKRNMVGGSTRHTMMFQQFGTSQEMNIAAFEDLDDWVYNILGVAAWEHVQDGAGFSAAAMTVMENWSYLDAAVGNTRKTIFGFHDPETGRFHEIKWAVTTLTNEIRLNSDNNYAEMMHKHMHSQDISGTKINLHHFWDKSTSYYSEHDGWGHKKITVNNAIYKYNPETNSYYELTALNEVDGKWEAQWSEVVIENNQLVKTGNTVSAKPQRIYTLYDIDQIFGGRYILEWDENDGAFKQTNLNAVILANIICEHNLKDKFTAYVVPHQAMKVGIRNRNSIDLFSEANANKQMYNFKLSLAYGGVQMDAEHAVEDGDVAEMMQAVAALIQNGYLTEYALDTYSLIGNVIRESIPSIRKAVSSKDEKEINDMLGKLLIEAFSKEGSTDRLGLVEAFVRRAEQKLRLKYGDIEIPFSANSIKGKFLSEIAARINKAIRRRYPGLGTVQVPSFKLMQVFNMGGMNMSFTKMSKYLHETKVPGSSKTYVQLANEIKSSGEINMIDYLKRTPVENLLRNQMVSSKTGTILNPLITLVSNKDDLNIEDTVVLRKKGSVQPGKVIAIKDMRMLNFLKHIMSDDVEIHKWNGKGQDLKPADTTISVTVDGSNKTISLYDLDTVVASFYLNDLADSDNMFNFDYQGLGFTAEEAQKHDETKVQYMIDFVKNVLSEVNHTIVFDPEMLKNGAQVAYLRSILLNATQKTNTILSNSYRSISVETIGNQYAFTKMLTDEQYIAYKAFAASDPSVTWSSDIWRSIAKYISVNHLNVDSEFSKIPADKIKLFSKHTIKKVHTEPPQIIMGRAYASLLGIGKNDNIWDITGPEYFAKKIKNIYNVPPKNQLDAEAYDVVLFTENNKRLFVKVGEGTQEAFEKCMEYNSTYKVLSGNLYMNSNLLCEAVGMDVYTYKADDGTMFDVIRVNDFETLDVLVNSGYFENIYYNYTHDNYIDLAKYQDITDYIVMDDLVKMQEQGLKEHIEILSNRRYQAFLETLNFIGSRIPTQSMQSFSSAKLAYFSDIETNESYLPRVVTWIEGSDYDIDKWYLLGLGLTKYGTIATFTDLDKYKQFKISDLFALPMPTGLTYGEMKKIDPVKFNRIGDYAPVRSNDTGDIIYRVVFESDDKQQIDTKLIISTDNKISIEGVSNTDDAIVVLTHVMNKHNLNLSDYTITSGLDDFASLYGFSKVNDTDFVYNSESILITSDDANAVLSGDINPLKRWLAAPTSVLVFDDNVSAINKKRIIKLLNAHSKTRRGGKVKDLALKNGVFYRIQKTVLDPISQINLHVQIAMDAPREAASKSELGRDEMYLNVNNPFTIFKMQEANMSGKNVVGIGATSLKTFFASSTYFNKKANEIKNLIGSTDFNKIYEILNDICFDANNLLKNMNRTDEKGIQPPSHEIRCLSNIYWTPVLRELKSRGITDVEVSVKNPKNSLLNDRYVYVRDGKTYLRLSAVITKLDETSKYNNAADDISAIISAATDNAKELILSKLNATEKFADIYTYLLSIGETFSDIATMMTSPLMTLVNKYAKTTFLDNATRYLKIEDVISFVLDEKTLFSSINSAMNQILVHDEFYHNLILVLSDEQKKMLPSLSEWDKKTYQEKKDLIPVIYKILRVNSKAQDELLNAIGVIKAISVTAPGYRHPDEGYEDLYSYDPEDMQEDPGSRRMGKNLSDLKASDFDAIYDYVKNYLIPKNQELVALGDRANLKMLEFLKNDVIPGCKEQQRLGKLVSVNKGLKTNDYDEYSYIQSFNAWINQLVLDKEIKVSAPFDLLRFVSDEDYKKEWIEKYESLKISRNILAIVTEAPHFNEMLKLLSLNRSMLEHAAVFRIERMLANKILKTHQGYFQEKDKINIEKQDVKSMSSKEFDIVKAIVSEMIPLNWLLHSNLSYTLPEGNLVHEQNQTSHELAQTVPFYLDTVHKIASFKHYLDSTIIPNLILKYGESNKFFMNLRKSVVNDPVSKMPRFKWVPDINVTDDALDTNLIYQDMLEGFNEIAHKPVNEALNIEFNDDVNNGHVWTISDLFFVYDLITSKGSISRDGYIRFFNDQIKMGNRNSLSDQYHDYIIKLDRSGDNLESLFDKTVLNEFNFHFKTTGNTYMMENYGVSKTVDNVHDDVLISVQNRHQMSFKNYPPSDYTFDLWATNITNSSRPIRQDKIEVKANKTISVTAASGDVFNEIIGYFQKLFGDKIKLPIEIVTNADLVRMRNEGKIQFENDEELARTMSANGFIYNGTIYINRDHNIIEAPLHEIMHVICAGFKFNRKYRDLYYDMLDKIKEHPDYYSMLKSVQNRSRTSKEGDYSKVGLKHGSDLKEEVLVEMLAKAFKTDFEKHWGPTQEVLQHDLANIVIDVLNDMFGTNIGLDNELVNNDTVKLGNTILKDIFVAFKSKAFDPEYGFFTKTRVPMNQMLSTIKRKMINEGLIEYDGDCY